MAPSHGAKILRSFEKRLVRELTHNVNEDSSFVKKCQFLDLESSIKGKEGKANEELFKN